MSFTFRRWLSWQNVPTQRHGIGMVGTFHAPTALRRASQRVTEPWNSPTELLDRLGAEDDWYRRLITEAADQYDLAFRRAIGPRNGPHTADRTTIWTRVIGGHHYLFWAWHDRLDIHLVTNNDQPPTRIHTYRKDTR
ncbi:hypothetical protein [Kitasatospora sp. P5_F3]